jgi:lipopolysaccharide export system permease protein
VVERIIDSAGEKEMRYDTMNLDISLKPHELRKDDYLKDKLTTPELIAFIKQEEARGTEGLNTYKVERYRRTATPAAVLLLTMIGAVIASRKNRGGSGMHLAWGSRSLHCSSYPTGFRLYLPPREIFHLLLLPGFPISYLHA